MFPIATPPALTAEHGGAQAQFFEHKSQVVGIRLPVQLLASNPPGAPAFEDFSRFPPAEFVKIMACRLVGTPFQVQAAFGQNGGGGGIEVAIQQGVGGMQLHFRGFCFVAGISQVAEQQLVQVGNKVIQFSLVE
ncbi:MAG: hypothetical protein H6569_12330 [Lewinellaceae bacterium]|nr:hypothetical protein [Lewinellaceae bacterium]